MIRRHWIERHKSLYRRKNKMNNNRKLSTKTLFSLIETHNRRDPFVARIHIIFSMIFMLLNFRSFIKISLVYYAERTTVLIVEAKNILEKCWFSGACSIGIPKSFSVVTYEWRKLFSISFRCCLSEHFIEMCKEFNEFCLIRTDVMKWSHTIAIIHYATYIISSITCNRAKKNWIEST